MGHSAPPITVIGFRRPEHIDITLNALACNYGAQKSDLHIFIDGARADRKDEDAQVEKTYNLCAKFPWEGKKYIHKSKHNRGVQAGVRHAIDTVLSNHNSTLIVEDDIATGPHFYNFAVQGLQQFANSDNVAAICGHCYPFNRKKYNPRQAYFLRHFACWGWATWRRSWETVCWDTELLLQKLKKSKKTHLLDFGNSAWVSGLLYAQHKKQINTWDVQTGVSFFLNNQLCLYPPETLTNNIGWRDDALGSHTSVHTNINAPLCYSSVNIPKNMPVEESRFMRKAYTHLVCPAHKRCLEYIKKPIRPLYHHLRRGAG